MKKEDFIFFWGGIYSQWYPSKFVIGNIEYNCAEQYMMSKKALSFGDEESNNKIMSIKDPRIQKQYGREVKGFDVESWNNICRLFVYEANYAKFSQNSDLFDELILTGNKEIVEASPEDKIWGIGLHESDERAWNKETWLGTNWLGEAIMKVRSEFYKQFDEKTNTLFKKLEKDNPPRIRNEKYCFKVPSGLEVEILTEDEYIFETHKFGSMSSPLPNDYNNHSYFLLVDKTIHSKLTSIDKIFIMEKQYKIYNVWTKTIK